MSSGATPISDLTEEPVETNDMGYDDSRPSSDTNADHSDSDVSENGDVDSDSTQSSDTDSMPSLDGDDLHLREMLRQWAIEEQITQAALKKLLSILREYDPDLPKDPRTLLHTGKIGKPRTLSDGEYYHFGIKNGIISKLSIDPQLQSKGELLLQLNVDGLPLFKSTNEQFWPILGMLVEATRPQPFVIGLFSGKSKPGNVDEFLKDFVEEMGDLEGNGLMHDNKVYAVAVSSVVCDAPARAFLKRIKGHSGYSGCDKCTQPGVYNSKMTFPEVDAPIRTNVAFDEMEDAEHHKGPSPFQSIHLGIITQFPLDYMHCICLGVMRRLLRLWTKGPLTCRLGPQTKDLISSALLSLSSFMPREFARKPRSLKDLDRWKATELRLFLLYTGPVVLYNKIPTELYSNFMLLSVGIHMLLNRNLCDHYADYAHQLLVSFVQHYSQLFGTNQVVYNVHTLVHLADDVRNHGSLENISGFPFENFLGSLKRLVRKPSFAIEQVIQRLSDKSSLPQVPSPVVGCMLKQQHFKGPLPTGNVCTQCTQYGLVIINNIVITTRKGDNCIQVGSEICIVKNIVQCETGVYFVYTVHTI